jgi:N-acetylneuraminic acid mutarotase
MHTECAIDSPTEFSTESHVCTVHRYAPITPRRAFGAAILDGTVYAVGGSTPTQPQLATVERLTSDGVWQYAPSLRTPRSQHQVVTTDNALWLVGGWNSEHGLVRAVEHLGAQDDAWEVRTHLPTPRREPAAAVLGDEIIVAGGFNGRNDGDEMGYLAIVEAYNVQTNTWRRLPSMRTPRRGLSLVSADGCLYAIGGYVMGRGFLNTVECYDPAANRWQVLRWSQASLIRRTWAVALEMDGHVLIVGGYNLDGYLGTVERVNLQTGEVCYTQPLPTPRVWLAAVSFKGGVLAMGGEVGFDVVAGIVEWINPICAN